MSKSQHAPRGRLKARDPIGRQHPIGRLPATMCQAKCRGRDKQCGHYAIAGGTVCRYHGGRAPQVMKAAQRRLDELKQPAIAYLAYLLAQRDYPSAGLGAAKDVLDRVDGKAAETLRVIDEAALEAIALAELAKGTRRAVTDRVKR